MSYLSTAAVLIKEYEGLRLVSYKWPHETSWTIGYGHTGKDVYEGQEISIEEAESFLMDDMIEADGAIDDYCNEPLTDNQRAAFISFIFNLGAGNFRSSTMLRLFNYGDIEGCAKQFSRWNKAGGVVLPGLVKRRNAESKLFLTP